MLESQREFYDFSSRLLLLTPACLPARARTRAFPLRLVAMCVCAVRDARARCGVTGKKGDGKCISIINCERMFRRSLVISICRQSEVIRGPDASFAEKYVT